MLHLYNEPEALYRAPMLYKQLMTERGIDRPIWINETNVAPWDDPANPLPRSDFRATLDEQASYIVQAFAWAVAAGVEYLSFYPLADGEEMPPSGELMGLLRRDGSERPAYQALTTVTRYLRNVNHARVERDGDAVKIIFERHGETITIA